mmetsp:Transcript_1184/g.2708  ORF Transcript_1184/g.2708 Transcript_1184/m.2708 type:complete len:162 (-) Transcript_1184:431-916(-)
MLGAGHCRVREQHRVVGSHFGVKRTRRNVCACRGACHLSSPEILPMTSPMSNPVAVALPLALALAFGNPPSTSPSSEKRSTSFLRLPCKLMKHTPVMKLKKMSDAALLKKKTMRKVVMDRNTPCSFLEYSFPKIFNVPPAFGRIQKTQAQMHAKTVTMEKL